jgi:hypothetical protein
VADLDDNNSAWQLRLGFDPGGRLLEAVVRRLPLHRVSTNCP